MSFEKNGSTIINKKQKEQKKEKKRKKHFLMLPIYVLYIVIFECILGLGFGDIWDRLVKWSGRINK